MSTLATIFDQYGDSYRQAYGSKMLPSHLVAMRAIQACRTAQLGGWVYHCANCEQTHYSYHSCQNRHCPQCQTAKGQEWLHKQQQRLLPSAYHLLTFTVPQELRGLIRSHQKELYSLLFRASAQATQALALDPKWIGGKIGMIGVLHTWGRQLIYHPHIHYLVPAGCVTATGDWQEKSHNFFLPVKALSQIFRAKFRDGLAATDWFDEIPSHVWHKDWVVHAKPVGNGDAALKYLAPYIFRVAISNKRILKLDKGMVTFRFRRSDNGQWRTSKVTAFEFIRRFLQHTLPKGFVKVRYYGFFAPSNRALLDTIRQSLTPITTNSPPTNVDNSPLTTSRPAWPDNAPHLLCPHCQQPLIYQRPLLPRSRAPP